MFLWFRLIASWMAFGANLAPFWEGFGSQVGPKLAPNRSQNRLKKLLKKWLHFGSLPDRFLVDFGLQHGRPRGSNEMLFGALWVVLGHLGAKMAPRPLQEGLGTDFWTNFGRFLEQFWLIFDAFLTLGAILGPRWPPDPSERPPGSILDRFWIDLGSIFDRFWLIFRGRRHGRSP